MIFFGSTAMASSFTKFLDHTQRRATVGIATRYGLDGPGIESREW
jgi:hypothetical protein